MVWLQSGTPQPPWPLNLVVGVGSSDDAEFQVGKRYVVATEGDSFRTNACLVTKADDSSAAALAPADPREPVGSGTTGAEPPPSMLALNIAAVAVIAGVAALAFRWARLRRRHRREPRVQL